MNKMTGSLLSGKDFTERLNAIAEVRFAEHQFGVSELAREMRFSRTTLHRRMKEVFQISASNYLRNFRLENARLLLQNRKFTIKKIASLCGFHSATYFNKCFREYYGIPPGEARDKVK